MHLTLKAKDLKLGHVIIKAMSQVTVAKVDFNLGKVWITGTERWKVGQPILGATGTATLSFDLDADVRVQQSPASAGI